MKYTIRHKPTSKVIDVTPEKWAEIKTRSRGWEKIGQIEDEPKKKAMFIPKTTVEKVEGVLDIIKDTE